MRVGALPDGSGRYRLDGLRLDGPGAGVHVYWLTAGETYRLRHDGAAWTVTGGSWFRPGITYRLTRAGRPATALPGTGGDPFTLDTRCEYELRGPEWMVDRKALEVVA
ncbi:hypothetical protein [Longispora albida]|uniref:hypothetical protein n=1 Tax=Longispora albida TaxID=203523 RepID=UPI00036FB130|nr:hypothetical protein [Longispora albida]